MKITTKIRDWKNGETAEMRTLCAEDLQALGKATINAVHDMLKDAGRDPLSISVELGVTINEAANPDPPKKKATRKNKATGGER